MEYKILHDNNLLVLVEAVNEAIEDGWLTLGGLAIKNHFYQAMTRTDENKAFAQKRHEMLRVENYEAP